MNLPIPCFAKLSPAANRSRSAPRRVAARQESHFCLSRWDSAAQDWRPLEEGGRVRTYGTLPAAIRARADGQHDTAIEQHRGSVLVMRLLPPLPLGSLNAYREGHNGAIPRTGLSREEIIARAREVFGEEAVMQIVNGHGRVFLEDGNVLRFANLHQLLDHAEQHAARVRT